MILKEQSRKGTKAEGIDSLTVAVTKAGQSTREAIIDGAYALLQEEGVGGISTRRIASRAGVNQALVHYHFGSVEQLMAEVLNRLAIEVMGRYRNHYTGEQSFAEKYRADMRELLTDDIHDSWHKVWLEAVALALNSPDLLATFLAEQRIPARRFIEDEALHAMGRTDRQSREDAEGISALIAMVRSGLVIDRLTGASRGHVRAIELLGDFLATHTERTGASAVAAPRKRKPAKAVSASAPMKAAKAPAVMVKPSRAKPAASKSGKSRVPAAVAKKAAGATRAASLKKR